jgi:hypothetical protein
MELPQYIQNKIRQQNESVSKARKLEIEVDNWCANSGIDIWGEEYEKTKGRLVNAVTPIDGDAVKRLYKG